MKVSMCVHSFDEAAALRRLIASSLPLADLFDEWVVMDHRSTDNTQDVLRELAPLLAASGVRLVTLHEPRDLSAAFTFADLRDATIRACSNDVVVLHDADFVLGPAFRQLIRRATAALRQDGSVFYGAGFNIPVVWDRLRTNSDGVVTDHGRVWLHSRVARILYRDAVRYRQTGKGGRWEAIEATPDRPRRKHLTGKRPALAPSAVVSVNAKPAERIERRTTMTMFMEDATNGRLAGTWTENIAAGTIRKQEPYQFTAVDLRGWHLHAADMDVHT